MSRTKAPYSLLYSHDADAAAWWAKQADVDAGITGLARNHEADRMIADMDEFGIDALQQIERLKRQFRPRKGQPSARP